MTQPQNPISILISYPLFQKTRANYIHIKEYNCTTENPAMHGNFLLTTIFDEAYDDF